jgi:hypothetical protein
MGFLFAILGFLFPRLLLICFWLFTQYPDRAFEGWVWPLLGWFCLPRTTLVYIWAMISTGGIEGGGAVTGGWIVWLIIAVLFDLGSNKAESDMAKKINA